MAPGGPNRAWEAQNGLGRPKTDGTKSAFFDAEARGSKCPVGPGRVGSGRVATETEIRNEPPSKRAQEKNYAVRANPSLR